MNEPTVYAIGMVRVSQRGGRDDDELHSPDNQRAKLDELCHGKDWHLLDVLDEGFVSGGKGLEDRPMLLAAVERIERREAQVLAVAFRDRLDREPAVRDAVIDRVEKAGGIVWAADSGQDTNGTPTQQFSGTVLAAAGRMIRRQAGERSKLAVADVVASGVVPFKVTTPGYRADDDNRLHVVPDEAKVVKRAFELRAEGKTIAEVRAFLADHGIERSYHGTMHLLRSRIVLGEIHFGALVNPSAHEPIVDADLWKRVQGQAVSRGRKAQSERLLARLGVLRCKTCGGRMVVGTHRENGRMYPFYRCGHVREDCPRRVTISAEAVEALVWEATVAATRDINGRAARQHKAREAARAASETQERYDALIRLLDPLEPAAHERLEAAKAERDRARDAADRLQGSRGSLLVDPESLTTLAERRGLILRTVASATVAPAAGGPITDRVEIDLL